uniref:Uncharacterized protein n=1 Tax=Tanacetum cinerariifolium TaxID=118510 RepID=A0A699JGN3_TANCI|nr:hypothetical protein [Tanacetum cinerariifolium]
MADYSFWEVIKNGNKVLMKTVGTVEQTYETTFVEEKLDRKNKMKARGTLLIALPNKDQLKFHSYTSSTSNTNEADNTAYGISTAHTQVNYIPPKPDIMFIDEQVENEYVDVVSNVSPSAVKTVESVDHDCDKRVMRPVWKNSRRANHENFANKMTHPHPKRRFVPQAILTKSGKLNIVGTPANTVRPVNTADLKPIMYYSRPISNAFKKGYLQAIRPFNKYSAYKKTIFNKEGNPQQKEYKEKGVIDSGYSRHMTGNNCYLTNYEDYDGGFVSFGDGKGRISRKGQIKLEHWILMMCTSLLDESQVLPRVPRKDNTYNVDLKSVVPTGGLTCLFAKATTDESNL